MKVYEFIKMNSFAFKAAKQNKIGLENLDYISMYDDWERLSKEGHKASYISYYLSQQYNISERTFFRIIRRMKSEIKL